MRGENEGSELEWMTRDKKIILHNKILNLPGKDNQYNELVNKKQVYWLKAGKS